MSNPNVAQGKVRPGLEGGRSNEFTLIMKLKPGGAERLRKKMASDPNFAGQNQKLVDRFLATHPWTAKVIQICN